MKKALWMVVLAGALFSMALPAVTHASDLPATASTTAVANDDPPVWVTPPANPAANPSDDPPVW